MGLRVARKRFVGLRLGSGLRATRKRFVGLRVTRKRFVGLRVARKRFVGLRAARSGLRVARNSDSEVLRAAKKLQKPASAGLRVAGLRSCWLGAPLKPLGGS